MRALFLACLVLAAICEELHFYHYTDGQLTINKNPAVKVDGPLYINFRATVNSTLVAGTYVKGSDIIPFGFTTKITKFEKNGDNIKLEGSCWEAGWGRTYMNNMIGTITMTGTYQKATYNGTCTDPNTKTAYTVTATGTFTSCRVLYSEVEAAKRAAMLIGAKAELYHPVHVLDHSYLGYAYLAPVPNCKYYLDNFKDQPTAKPGFAIVAKDGSHCAVVDNEGDKFIHSNPVKKEVTINPLTMINDYFKGGYVFKDVKC